MAERVLGSFPVRVVKRYAAANGSTWAINVAWNALFAFFPIILAVTLVLGLFAGGSGITGGIDRGIVSGLPGQDGMLVVQALHAFKQSAGWLAVVSFLGLLWSGTALFGAMDQGLDAIYATKPRGFVSQKLMGVAMILVFTVLIVVDVASASLIPLIGKLPSTSFLSSGPIAVLLQIAVGVFDGLLLFGAIYFVVPNRKQKLREILPGALAAALLFEAFTLLFPVYFALAHGFSTYGSTFALFFLLLTFAFWIGQITMLGGAVNAVLHAERAGVPAPARPEEPERAAQQQLLPEHDPERELAGSASRRDAVDASRPSGRRERKIRGDGWDPAAARR